jgi:cytochrome c peroxidase
MNRLPVLFSITLAMNTAIAADPWTGNAETGQQLWTSKHVVKDETRSCTACHTADPRQGGKHIRTGKAIKPLSPTANPNSLTDAKKIEKWFRRNCNWTMGRECSAREKADILAFLKSN